MFFKSLASRIIISTIGIVVVTLTVITLFFNKKLTDELSGEFEKNAMNMIQVTKNQVESHYNNITFYQSVMLNRRKAELKNNSTIAFNILKLLHQAYQEKLIDEETAVRLSIDRIRKLRYDNDTGYFWINDTTLPYPKMIVHPTLPHLDGQILDSEAFNSETATKENLFKVGVELSLANSEGFIEYLWPKPTPDGLTIQQPKISYVKRFEPWDWIIGTGVYIDDIEKDVRFMLHAVIEDLNYSFSEKRFGKNGYIFIVNDKKELLVHPQLEELTFKNAVNQLTGNLLFDDIKESFDNKRKYLDYVWQYTGENTDNDSIKRAYVIFFEPLGWYIICAINPDDFTNKLFNLSKTITLYSVILLSLAMIVSFLVTRSITNPLKKLIKSIQKTDQYGLPIDKIPALGTSETRLLGTIINKMLKTIYSSKIELQKSEAKYRGLIESTIDCVWEMNQDGRYTYVSPQFKNVFGYDVDELIGNSPLELMSDKEAKRLIRIFNRIKNNAETIYALESINLHKDGREIIIESNGVPILDDDGKLAGYRGVSRNITERKRSHERLKKYSKLKERLLISGSMEDKMKLITDGVLHILNVDSVRIWMDRKCESKDSPNIKCKYAEFVNNKKSHKCSLKIISESGSHIPQKDNISHSAPFGCYEIRRTLESKDFGFVTNDFKKDLLEFNGKKTEQYNWTAFAGFRLQSQQENTIGVLSVFSKKSFSSGEETLLKAIAGTTSEVILAVLSEDGLRLKTKELSIANKDLEKYKNHLEDLVKERTSELKKSLDDLKQAQNQLVQSEKMAALGSLVAGVAHEINTPVGIGVTTASHLEQETRTFMEKYKSSQITRKEFETYAYVAEESSAMILSNLTRAADLIQSFKRVAVDQSNEIKTNFKIKEYIDEILKSLNSKFKKTKHRIVVNCQKDFEVNNYPGAFSQIMTNLLMNSLIHGFENIDEGIVTIQIERSDDTAQIEYRDNGIGISKENMEKLFEPFFTTKRGQGGSGLGMHVTYNLVTQTMKGTLTCFSSPGEGTRFVLSFPLNLKD